MNQNQVNVEPDTVYYNITIPYSPDSLGNSPAIYQEQLNQPIVYDPSSYYLSVVRFQVSGNFIPLFIARIQEFETTGNTDINKTIYSFTLEYNNNFSPQTFVEFIPTNGEAQVPTTTNPVNYNTGYYNVFNYTDFLTMCNVALQTAFNAIPGGAPMGSVAPYFIYDPITLRISLIAQEAFYNQGPHGTQPAIAPINIYFNSNASRFFDAIPIDILAFNNSNGTDARFNVQNLYDSNWYTPSGPVIASTPITQTLIEMTQQYNILGNWNSLKSIQLISNLLPINREFTPTGNINSGIITSKGILADFVPLISDGPEARSSIEFISSGPWRLIDMFGNIPITKVDLQFVWTDELGNSFIIYLPENQQATCKLLFQKKSLFLGRK